jgi:hypothetical protein
MGGGGMDPVTLGLVAAAVVAKAALEQVGDRAGQAGWSGLRAVSARLRGWFAAEGREQGVAALEVVEAAPDSELAVQRLAVEVTEVVRDRPLAEELQRLLEELEADGGAAVASFVTEVRDQARVGRIVNVAGDYFGGPVDG